MSTPLPLMSAEIISTLIARIEEKFPGYWYSISQESGTFGVSMGPSLSCLFDTDRAWSQTKDGDSGIVQEFDSSLYQDKSLLLETVFNRLETFVSAGRNRTELSTVGYPGKIYITRTHTSDQRKQFRRVYSELPDAIVALEDAGYQMTEVYIGSCYLSADVSLRGKILATGEDFDFSMDLREDGHIAQSLHIALTEALDTVTEKV